MSIILGNLLITVGQALGFVINIYVFLLLGRVIISWVNADPYNGIVRFLTLSTEPILSRIRRRMPRTGQIDLSPMVLLLVLYCLHWFLVATLIQMGHEINPGAL